MQLCCIHYAISSAATSCQKCSYNRCILAREGRIVSAFNASCQRLCMQVSITAAPAIAAPITAAAAAAITITTGGTVGRIPLPSASPASNQT